MSKSLTFSKNKQGIVLTIIIIVILVIAGVSGVNIVFGSGMNIANNSLLGIGGVSPSFQGWTSASSTAGAVGVGCVQPLASRNLQTYYSEPYCYGHDEAVLGFVSNQSGSGGNMVLNVTLPTSSSTPQGALYIAFWVGGVAYDPASAGNQAFMEFQFYPAAPAYIGAQSAPKDCNSSGFFFNDSTAGVFSNEWFACAFVFAFNSTTAKEYVAYSSALVPQGLANSTMVMRGNDLISIKLNGTAQSTTKPWQISLFDHASSMQSSVLSLANRSTVFSPYYSISSPTSGLIWGADQSPAIDFAFEIGHSIAGDCSGTNFQNGGTGGVPGDGTCDSYAPGLWSQAGLIHIHEPLMGTTPSLPIQIAFSSSQGGVSEVYNSSQPLSRCRIPSFDTSLNCIYPFYAFEYNTSSFVFLSSIITSGASDYGNTFQFPGTFNTTSGQFPENLQPAPNTQITYTPVVTQTTRVVSIQTATSISVDTTTKTSTQTVTEAGVQVPALTVQTRASGGSVLSGQIVTLTNSSGFSRQGTTDAQGDVVFTGLMPGSVYTATSNIAGENISSSMTFTGQNVILLQAPSPSGSYIPYVLLGVVIVIAVASGVAVVLRRRSPVPAGPR